MTVLISSPLPFAPFSCCPFLSPSPSIIFQCFSYLVTFIFNVCLPLKAALSSSALLFHSRKEGTAWLDVRLCCLASVCFLFVRRAAARPTNIYFHLKLNSKGVWCLPLFSSQIRNMLRNCWREIYLYLVIDWLTCNCCQQGTCYSTSIYLYTRNKVHISNLTFPSH
jgi:hypothetical protein